MARSRSSRKSTPRSLQENASRTQTPPPRWVVESESGDDPMDTSDDDQVDLMDDSSDDPKQNVRQTTTTALVAEEVEMVATSPSLPSRKERTRSIRKETKAFSDMAHISSKQHREATVDDDLEVDQEPPTKSRRQQTRIEQAIDIPNRAENDETSSRQSSTGPEASSHSSGSKEADQNPPTTDLNDIISGMSEAIKKGFSKKEENGAGRVYFLEDTSGKTSRFKIGNTSQKKVEVRVNAQIRKCRLKGSWKHRSYPDSPIRGYIHLEKISHKELSYMRISFDCPCNTDHCEYFDGEKEIARRTIQFWARWLKACQPYDNDGSLLPFWTARLDYFEHKKDHYFRCLEPSCKRPSACQACLRAGWKAWTEPTTRDQIKFWMWSSIAIPNICFHLIGCLTAVSLFLSPIPLSVIVRLTGWLRQLEITIIILTYVWIYQEGIFKYIAAPSDKPKSNQQAQERQPTTPEKQPETVHIPHTAPARLPDVASITNHPQDQIPNTAPIQTKRTRSERYLIPEESPSKAAQRRRRASKSPTPPSETDIEEALKRSVDESKQDGVGGAVVEG